jgi:hypothetical protein
MASKRKTPIQKPVLDQLSPEEIKAAKLKAKREFDESLKAKQVADLVEYEKQELERLAKPEERPCFIRVMLPPFANEVVLDGTVYQHGWHGEVPYSKYLSMQDIIARAWDHQYDTEGHKYPNRRPQREIVLGAGDINVSSRSLLERRM